MASSSSSETEFHQTHAPLARLAGLGQLEFTHWPLVAGGLWGALPVLGLVAAGGLVQAVTQNWYITTAVIAGVLLASWRYWVRIRVKLTPREIQQRAFGYTWRMPWSDFRTYHFDQQSLLLLPNGLYPLPCALGGLWLHGGNRMDLIREWFDQFVHPAPPHSVDSTVTLTSLNPQPRG